MRWKRVVGGRRLERRGEDEEMEGSGGKERRKGGGEGEEMEGRGGKEEAGGRGGEMVTRWKGVVGGKEQGRG